MGMPMAAALSVASPALSVASPALSVASPAGQIVVLIGIRNDVHMASSVPKGRMSPSQTCRIHALVQFWILETKWPESGDDNLQKTSSK